MKNSKLKASDFLGLANPVFLFLLIIGIFYLVKWLSSDEEVKEVPKQVEQKVVPKNPYKTLKNFTIGDTLNDASFVKGDYLKVVPTTLGYVQGLLSAYCTKDGVIALLKFETKKKVGDNYIKEYIPYLDYSRIEGTFCNKYNKELLNTTNYGDFIAFFRDSIYYEFNVELEKPKYNYKTYLEINIYDTTLFRKYGEDYLERIYSDC